VIQLQPNNAVAWFNRGAALGNLQRYEDAIASFNKAIQIQPDFDVAIENRKQALSQIHQNSQTTCGVFGGYPCQRQ
jgi:tetratricopeptide (TPR) repeat protein